MLPSLTKTCCSPADAILVYISTGSDLFTLFPLLTSLLLLISSYPLISAASYHLQLLTTFVTVGFLLSGQAGFTQNIIGEKAFALIWGDLTEVSLLNISSHVYELNLA